MNWHGGQNGSKETDEEAGEAVFMRDGLGQVTVWRQVCYRGKLDWTYWKIRQKGVR